MTTNAEHAARNQQMILLVLGLTAVKALVRNKVILAVGLAGLAVVTHRKGVGMSAAVRRLRAEHLAAWRRG
jgi:hypothetical protein